MERPLQTGRNWVEFFSPGWAQKPMSCSDGDVWIFPLVPRPRHFPYRSHHLKGSYIYVLCSKNIAFPSSPAPSSPFSLFFSAPFPYWDFFFKRQEKKTWHSFKFTERMSHTFHPTSEMWRNSKFPVPPGWEKNPEKRPIKCLSLKSKALLGFQPGRVAVASEGRHCSYSLRVSSEFLAILQSFCRWFSRRRIFDKRRWKRCGFWLLFAWPFSWWTPKRWDLLQCRPRPVFMKDSLFSLDKHCA